MDNRRGFLKRIGMLGAALFVIPKTFFSSPVKPPLPDLGRRGFLPWKTYYSSVNLNEQWIGRDVAIRPFTP